MVTSDTDSIAENGTPALVGRPEMRLFPLLLLLSTACASTREYVVYYAYPNEAGTAPAHNLHVVAHSWAEARQCVEDFVPTARVTGGLLASP
jgi:hypothetical protein